MKMNKIEKMINKFLNKKLSKKDKKKFNKKLHKMNTVPTATVEVKKPVEPMYDAEDFTEMVDDRVEDTLAALEVDDYYIHYEDNLRVNVKHINDDDSETDFHQYSFENAFRTMRAGEDFVPYVNAVLNQMVVDIFHDTKFLWNYDEDEDNDNDNKEDDELPEYKKPTEPTYKWTPWKKLNDVEYRQNGRDTEVRTGEYGSYIRAKSRCNVKHGDVFNEGYGLSLALNRLDAILHPETPEEETELPQLNIHERTRNRGNNKISHSFWCTYNGKQYERKTREELIDLIQSL